LLALSSEIDIRRADQLTPLTIAQPPDELKPIIQALNGWMQRVS